MHRAFGAGGLAFLEGAMQKAFYGIISEIPALNTRFAAGVMIATIQGDHHSHGFAFAGDPGGHFISYPGLKTKAPAIGFGLPGYLYPAACWRDG
jgi:hypothetical protein